MSTRVDVEDIQTTTSEKLLALVLVGFLLIGGVWTYQRIDDEVRDAVAVEDVRPSAADQATLQRLEDARVRLDVATQARAAARDNLELRREAYRTALDAGRQTATRASVRASAGSVPSCSARSGDGPAGFCCGSACGRPRKRSHRR